MARDFPPLRALADRRRRRERRVPRRRRLPDPDVRSDELLGRRRVPHRQRLGPDRGVSVSPAAGVTSVATDTTVSCRFSEPVVASSVVMTVATADGIDIPGTVSYEPAERTASIHARRAAARTPRPTSSPSPARPTSPDRRSRHRSRGRSPPPGCPGTLPTSIWTSAAVPATTSSNDTSAVELGLRFRSDVAGFVTAVRYYRGGGNSGNHVGRVWALDGTLLGTATFDAESDEGWQQAPLDPAVQIEAGTTYVVSYLAPNGGYAADAGIFGSSGVTPRPLARAFGRRGGRRQRRVPVRGRRRLPDDVVGQRQLLGGPRVRRSAGPRRSDRGQRRSPRPISSRSPRPSRSSCEFDEAVDPPSLEFGLTGPGDAPCRRRPHLDRSRGPSSSGRQRRSATGTTLHRDGDGRRCRRQRDGRTRRVVVHDGGRRRGSTPATIWTTSAVPAVAAANDPSAIEVGVKFGVDVAGAIAGIRFYKGPGNVGPHTARLWASDGQLLGSVVAGTESATGWQQAWFGAPMPVQPGQWYVASYHTPTGRYSVTGGGLSSAVVRPPLRALASAAVGGNGVYRYGAGGFPNGLVCRLELLRRRALHRPRRAGRHGPDPGSGSGRGVDDDAASSSRSASRSPSGSVQAELRDGAGVTVPVTVEHAPGSAQTTIRPVGTVGERHDLHGERARSDRPGRQCTEPPRRRGRSRRWTRRCRRCSAMPFRRRRRPTTRRWSSSA